MNDTFCLFKTEKKRVVWEVTQLCNFSCLHCCSKSGKVDTSKELNLEQALSILDDLKNNNVEEIYFSGGEPFIREDMLDILRYTKKLGIRANISTNGSFMTEELANQLKESGVNLIHISLDSNVAQEHNAFRGGDYFDVVIAGIKNAVKAGLCVRVGTILWAKNYQKIQEMVMFMIDLGVQEVVFNWLVKVGRYKENLEIGVPLSEFDRSIAIVTALKEELCDKICVSMHRSQPFAASEKTCQGGQQIFYILPDGAIAPCSWLAKLDCSVISKHSLKECSLKTIQAGNEFQNWKSILNDRSQEFSSGCPAICRERNGTYFSEDPLLMRNK